MPASRTTGDDRDPRARPAHDRPGRLRPARMAPRRRPGGWRGGSVERAPCEPARGQPRRGATPRDRARRRAGRDGSARLDGADRRTPRRGGRNRAPDPRGVAAAPRRVRAHPRRGRRPRLPGDRWRPGRRTRAGFRRDRSACRLRRPRGTCPACRGSARGRTDDRPAGPLDRYSVHWPDPNGGRPAPRGDR